MITASIANMSFADLAAWLLTQTGLGLVAAAFVWLLFKAYQGHYGIEMPVGLKAACAFIGPFVVAILGYSLYVIVARTPFSVDALASVLIVAGQMALDGQAVYNGVRLVQKWWEARVAQWTPPPAPPTAPLGAV